MKKGRLCQRLPVFLVVVFEPLVDLVVLPVFPALLVVRLLLLLTADEVLVLLLPVPTDLVVLRVGVVVERLTLVLRVGVVVERLTLVLALIVLLTVFLFVLILLVAVLVPVLVLLGTVPLLVTVRRLSAAFPVTVLFVFVLVVTLLFAGLAGLIIELTFPALLPVFGLRS